MTIGSENLWMSFFSGMDLMFNTETHSKRTKEGKNTPLEVIKRHIQNSPKMSLNLGSSLKNRLMDLTIPFVDLELVC